MALRRVKSILVGAFSLFSILFSNVLLAEEHHEGGADTAQHAETKKKEGFNASEVIFGHILDGHEFHFLDIKGKDGEIHPISIPLPIILYTKEGGFKVFMSSKFHHGHTAHEGFRMLDEHYLHQLTEQGVDVKKEMLSVGKIIAVDQNDKWLSSVKVLDLSLTRNVVQMLIALFILTWLMLSIAKSYKKGLGVTSAPKGKQNLMEPVITFVRDEVAKPNLGHKYEKYLPYLLTVFFFILINNVIGLIPGTANVTGNIAFTAVLGVISFVVILFSSNSHYWGHIFNPPGVPLGVKFILVPVEFLSVFIKPFALIIRLFANMVAGHIIIICLISLIFIFGQMNAAVGYGTSPIALGFTVFIYMIEVLVAFLQAFIFTNLTAVFIGQAFEGEHHEEAHH
jgi:F-type H+-transporting ATPase subunit a